jgi:hypothetical protein
VIGAVIIAPVSEELVFRELILRAIFRETGRKWLAIVISAVLFGSVHLMVPHSVVALTTLGLALGIVRVMTGSIWAPIWLHVIFNARTIVYLMLAPELVSES